MDRGVNAAGVVSKSLVLVLQLLRGDDHVCVIGYQGVLIARSGSPADAIVWVLHVLHAVRERDDAEMQAPSVSSGEGRV
jgi:hypothetical protein